MILLIVSICLPLILLLGWEHVADIAEKSTAKPSYLINEFIANVLIPSYQWFGVQLAYVSSFFHYLWTHFIDLLRLLKLERLVNNAAALCESLFNLSISWFEVVVSYIKAVGEYKYGILVVLGTILIGYVTAWIAYMVWDRLQSGVLGFPKMMIAHTLQTAGTALHHFSKLFSSSQVQQQGES